MENKEKGGTQKGKCTKLIIIDEVQLNEKIQSSMGIGKVFKDFVSSISKIILNKNREILSQVQTLVKMEHYYYALTIQPR